MDATGPWATGRTDWSPLAGLTGTRPVVDRYSITRYSGNEWRTRTEDVIGRQKQTFADVDRTHNDTRNTMARTFAIVDRTQSDSTARLQNRSADVNKWKATLERAIAAQATEISTMEEQRVRLKESLSVLQKPEAIGERARDANNGDSLHFIIYLHHSNGVPGSALQPTGHRIGSRSARGGAHQRDRYDQRDQRPAAANAVRRDTTAGSNYTLGFRL